MKNSMLSCLYFIQNRLFSKKQTVLTPIFCQKNVHSLKNTVFSPHFFSKVSWKTPAVMPIFDQQTSILSKLAYYMSQKSQWDAPFANYHEKMSALMPVFCQKNVNSLKKHCSHAHILSKNILSKTRRSHVFFFFKKSDLLSCPYFVKKTSIL